MRRQEIVNAVEEARRFLIRAEDVLGSKSDTDSETYYGGSKGTGALRRASLDLTRALAELRRYA